MRERITIILLFFLLQGCYDEIVYDENPFLVKKKELDFRELSALDPVVMVGKEAKIKARATGDSLWFEWNAPEGTLHGNDTLMFFHHTDEGIFNIFCTAGDKYGNQITKEIQIHVTQEMVFYDLVCEEEEIPADFPISILAQASGEELTYSWSVSGGILQGEGAEVEFYSTVPGEYIITCTITDLVGESLTRDITIEVVEGFIFKELTADPERIVAHDNSYLTAHTLGHDLTYQWRCDPPAVLLGSGSSIIFNICHGDVFTVTCEVTDKKGNMKTKSVVITVTDL